MATGAVTKVQGSLLDITGGARQAGQVAKRADLYEALDKQQKAKERISELTAQILPLQVRLRESVGTLRQANKIKDYVETHLLVVTKFSKYTEAELIDGQRPKDLSQIAAVHNPELEKAFIAMIQDIQKMELISTDETAQIFINRHFQNLQDIVRNFTSEEYFAGKSSRFQLVGVAQTILVPLTKLVDGNRFELNLIPHLERQKEECTKKLAGINAEIRTLALALKT